MNITKRGFETKNNNISNMGNILPTPNIEGNNIVAESLSLPESLSRTPEFSQMEKIPGKKNKITPIFVQANKKKGTYSRSVSPSSLPNIVSFSPSPVSMQPLRTVSSLARNTVKSSYRPVTVRPSLVRNRATRRLTIGGKITLNRKPIFSYHSIQQHKYIIDGKEKNILKEVNIQNTQGEKKVEMRINNGRIRRHTKKLTKKEIEQIRKNQFIPNLFKDCIKNCKE